jgi:hypothetical protein
MKAAAVFMRTALSIVAEAQKDQGRTFESIKTVVADAREKLDDGWMRQTFLANDMTDLKTQPGKLFALAKRLDEVAQNLSDSYAVSVDADRFKDEQRKDTFRALLQESLVAYAEIVLALDETSVLLAKEWEIKPDVDKPIAAVSLPDVVVARPEKRRVASSTPPWLGTAAAELPTKGHIGLQGKHGDTPIYFRNLKIKPLSL